MVSVLLLSGPDPVTLGLERIWRLAAYTLLPLSRSNLWKCTRFWDSNNFWKVWSKELANSEISSCNYHIIPLRRLTSLKRTALDSLRRCELKLLYWLTELICWNFTALICAVGSASASYPNTAGGGSPSHVSSKYLWKLVSLYFAWLRQVTSELSDPLLQRTVVAVLISGKLISFPLTFAGFRFRSSVHLRGCLFPRLGPDSSHSS